MDNTHFHSQETDMDIIDNFDKLTIGQYIEIQAIDRDETLDDIDKQVQTISILTGLDVDEIMHRPITEYKEMAAKAAFIAPENIHYHPVAKKYLVGGFELVPVRDFRKIETCQYIDFQTYAQDLDKYLVEFLSVILVPNGHRYNEGYDILDVQRAIREDMSVSDGVSIAGFFLTWCRKSIQDSLNYSKREAMKIKDKEKREKILENIRKQERILGANGDGLQT